MTPAELSLGVRTEFSYAARYLSVLAGDTSHATAADILTRPDVEAVLKTALEQGRELALDAVREAWGPAPATPYLDWLLSDVDRSYDSMAVLRAAVRVSWHSALPGDRAAAVKQAVTAHGADIALRNRLSAEVAAVSAQAHAEISRGEQLQDAGEQVWKQWRCRVSPPDALTCHWCRALHGLVLPLHANFPAGSPVDLTGHGKVTRPPRLYHGILPGPPRHPRCRCRIVIITSLPGPVVSEGSQEEPASSFLSASAIRALPEHRYKSLLHFLGAAVHELGQVLGRLRALARKVG